ERHPKTVAQIINETNNPKNCAIFLPEATAISGLLYDSHMCSVDNRDDATTLACSYFQSGIRVYDIREPTHVKEIAYFYPPALTAGVGGLVPNTGSVSTGGTLISGGGPVWCAAIPFLDASTGRLYSTCADSGVLTLKFRDNVWPFEESKTPQDRQL